MDRILSNKIFKRARRSIAGGVNSPVRSFRGVGVPPVIAAYGKGSYLHDVDGFRYMDFLMSWGALILGHANANVHSAIAKSCRRGTGFGLSTEIECRLAEVIKKAFPSIELLRLVNSGTEAVMSTVRLARGYTRRTKIVMFEGCYHGHNDGLLAKAGSGLTTFGIPASAGVPASFTAETIFAQFNDLNSLEALCRAHGNDIACILVEPVAGNMGVVPPEPGFLQGVREAADKIGALLVFDEVITGFRIALGGAQERYGVSADLTILGKIIGGGLPIGAFGGRQEVMKRLAPIGDVYQAGTLSGNPVVAGAGLAVLEVLYNRNPYEKLEEKGRRIEEGLRCASEKTGIPLHVGRVGAMLTPFFHSQRVTNSVSARQSDARRYRAFFSKMLKAGILLPPSQWEACFISTAHSMNDVERFVTTAGEALYAIGRKLG